jgi:16S rRNA (cytidine1402-2'-O)-methyltransferase
VESALYVVATPIGNLADITRRAVEVLAAVDLVAAEDTRRTGQLLAHLGIDNRLAPYHDHSGPQDLARLVEQVCGGGSVALVSDAGTPLLADPGYRLVRAVQDRGARVVPVPGASALLAALCAAGLPTDRFRFEGFLPAKSEARRSVLADAVRSDCTVVFYEAPHRLQEALDDMLELCGPDREVVLGRELTKRFETLRRDRLGDLRDWVAGDADQRRGEIVLMLSPAPAEDSAQLPADLAELLLAMAEHMPPKRAATLLADYSGLRKRRLYEYLLSQRGD